MDLVPARRRSFLFTPSYPRRGLTGNPPPGRPGGGGSEGGPNGPKRTQSPPKGIFHFWCQKCKRVLIFHFWSPKCEKVLISAFDPQKCKIRCRNHWFHKHLRPGGKKGPKNAFPGPKTHFGAQNAFWAPKCILGSKMLPGVKGPKCDRLFRTAVVKTDVSKMRFL